MTSSETQSKQYSKLKETFPDLKLSEASYKNRASKLKNNITSLGKKDGSKKTEFLFTFSQEKWISLSEVVRKRHGNAEVCKGCLNDDRYRIPLSYIPINGSAKEFKKIAEENGLYRPVRHNIIEETKRDISELNSKYKEQFSVTFESALKMAEKSAVQKKWSQCAQEVKENIEEQWKETAVIRYEYKPFFSLQSRLSIF